MSEGDGGEHWDTTVQEMPAIRREENKQRHHNSTLIIIHMDIHNLLPRLCLRGGGGGGGGMREAVPDVMAAVGALSKHQ